MSMTQIRKRAKNLCMEVLGDLSESAREPFDFRDSGAKGEVLDRLRRSLEEGDTLDEALSEIIDAALRDADRTLTSTHVATSRQAIVGQGILFDYDPEAWLVLGEGLRIKEKFARQEHVEASLRIDTDGIVAQNAAFARKREWKQAAIDTFKTLPPDTTLADIVSDV